MLDKPSMASNIHPNEAKGSDMTEAAIQDWLGYWQAHNMVAIGNIRAFDQVAQARKFCECMRVGVFHPDMVSDLQIWRALSEMRSA